MTQQTAYQYRSPQELRAARIARQRREQARKARRRKYMIRRIIVLAIAVAFIALFAMGVKALVVALTAKGAAATDQTAVQTTIPYTVATTGEPLVTEPMVTEPQEPTTADLLASGVLTDEISLSYELQLVSRDAAKEFGIPYKLLLAVMFRESSYNPEAANSICYGLMQIHQMNFEWLEGELKEYGVTDIKNNPKDNIYAGAYMLGRLVGKYEDYHKALMAYNCGERRAKELWAEGYTSSTYSRNVIATMNELNVAE